MMLKAWTVTSPDEEYYYVVFAENRNKARAAGASEDGMYDYIEYEVKRSPAFDQYAEAGAVPIEALLKAGWWYTCFGCSGLVDQEAIDTGEAVLIDGKPYCKRCADRMKDLKEAQ